MTEQQLAAIWKLIQPELEVRCGATFYKTWLKQAKLAGIQGTTADLTVENQAAVSFITRHAEPHIKDLIREEAGTEISVVHYQVTPGSKGRTHVQQTQPEAALFTKEQEERLYTSNEPGVPVYNQAFQQPVGEPVSSNLNPKYTFDTFIVGTKNRLAYAAAQAVAENPGRAYNPLYLYGGVGLGKTHLMQAIGHEVIRREPQKRVIYASCEAFMNEFTASIRSGKADNFKKKYRNIDIFLVDDIQFIAGKDSTQEEFFHTFNALYQTDKQIVITSDKAPSDIKGLEERLSSRFSSGMLADMQLPDLETRQAILQAKCEEKGVVLPDSVSLFIADLVETNIRELEGALTTVLMLVRASGQPATIDLARDALKSFANSKPIKKSSLEQLKVLVCEFYDTDFKDIAGERRQRELVKPRQILMYLMKHELGMTFPTIGREIGGRDHTTAMHAVEKIEKEMKKSDELLQELTHIKELYYAAGR